MMKPVFYRTQLAIQSNLPTIVKKAALEAADNKLTNVAYHLEWDHQTEKTVWPLFVSSLIQHKRGEFNYLTSNILAHDFKASISKPGPPPDPQTLQQAIETLRRDTFAISKRIKADKTFDDTLAYHYCKKHMGPACLLETRKYAMSTQNIYTLEMIGQHLQEMVHYADMLGPTTPETVHAQYRAYDAARRFTQSGSFWPMGKYKYNIPEREVIKRFKQDDQLKAAALKAEALETQLRKKKLVPVKGYLQRLFPSSAVENTQSKYDVKRFEEAWGILKALP